MKLRYLLHIPSAFYITLAAAELLYRFNIWLFTNRVESIFIENNGAQVLILSFVAFTCACFSIMEIAERHDSRL